MASSVSSFAKGFLDGFGPGAFFFPAKLPGMPERVFAEATPEDLAWVEEQKRKAETTGSRSSAQAHNYPDEMIATVVQLLSAR